MAAFLNLGLQTLFMGIASKRGDVMGQLIVSEFVTLDGVMQAPGGPEEDTEGGFKHGGWQAPLLHEEALSRITGDIGRREPLHRSRRTYSTLAPDSPRASSNT